VDTDTLKGLVNAEGRIKDADGSLHLPFLIQHSTFLETDHAKTLAIAPSVRRKREPHESPPAKADVVR
jgi:hypothetical protein